MSVPQDDPDDPLADLEGDNEYRLAPEEPRPMIEPAWKPPPKSEEPPSDNEERQFSLAELLGLMGAAAVMLSIFSSIARWTGMGNSPAALAALFAYVLGFSALVGMVALALVPHARRIVLLGWWVLLGAYIVTAAAAVVLRK